MSCGAAEQSVFREGVSVCHCRSRLHSVMWCGGTVYTGGGGGGGKGGLSVSLLELAITPQ